jgi:glyoxylase-like metal-dependent hydrolase (beta-lactamase superfamily II)/rhodanese-related sulfurtransferase
MTAPEVHPVVDEGLGNSSYLVDLGDGRALVVDPVRDPSSYLDQARTRRLRITLAVETHLHADFVSGSRELAASGARVVAARAAGLRFPHQGLEDQQELDLGGLALRAVATPGHTPEHLAWLLLDGGRPLALFSGGALLVGGVARTDLVSPDQTGPLTRAAWRSLQRLRALPDDLRVYPTHGAGSFCSTPGEGQRTTTVGAERAHNLLLAAPDEHAFQQRLLGGLGSFPPYFLRLREVNRRGPRVLADLDRRLPRLPAEQVARRLEEGALLVDARPVTAFAAGHPAGALSIALRPAFATWLGWLVGPDRPLLFVLADDQDRAELLRQCHQVGYERLAGELAGGMAAWRAAGMPEGHLELVAAGEVAGPVLDVRQASEVAAGHVPGAVAVELGALDGGQGLPAGPHTVLGDHGERATTAASLLARAGRGELRVAVGGGPDEWSQATGRPLTRP